MSKKQSKPFQSRIVAHGEEAVDAILFNPANWRIHPKAQQDALEGVLSEVGWVQDVIVNRTTGHLVDGHLRCQVAARNGEKTVPVVYVELSEAEEALILASIDPIAAMAATDKAKLDALMAQVQSGDERVQAMMAEIAEKEGLEYGKKDKAEDPGAQVDKAEELRVKWRVEPGQLWQLGEHRLICGDCTDRAVVDRLMQGEKAGAVVTDPPYGINREGIEHDDPEGLPALFDGCLAVMPIDNAVVIAFQSPRLFPVWLDAIKARGHKFERSLWMHKSNDVTNPWRCWMMNGEPIFISSVGKPDWGKTDAVQDCYIITHDVGVKIPHTSVKPLPVTEDLVKHTTGIVYEPFSGSGTAICACEQTKRKCRAVEISPAYVAVTLERWSAMTGQTPTLLNVS